MLDKIERKLQEQYLAVKLEDIMSKESDSGELSEYH